MLEIKVIQKFQKNPSIPALICIFTISLLCVISPVFGQSRLPANPEAYLANSDTPHGDRDGIQVIFFQVPATVTDTLYFGIFDADVQGGFPDRNTFPSTTTTTFTLYGGSGAFSDPATIAYNYTEEVGKDATTGSVLQSVSADDADITLDGEWTYLPGVAPSQGERVGNFYYFKLVVTTAGDDLNGYRVDVSSTNYGDSWGTASGTPTSIPGVRSFAYIWTIMLSDTFMLGAVWDLYPFIPDGTTGNLQTYTWDWNLGGTFTGPVLSDTTGATIDNDIVTSDGNSDGYQINSASAGFPNNVTMSESALSGADNGTWKLKIINDADSLYTENVAEVWFGQGATDPQDLTTTDIPTIFRIYAAPYFPEPPQRVTGTVTDGTALNNGIDREKVLLQLVDSSGNPAPYVRNVYLSVDNGAEIEATSNEAGPLNAADRIVTTDSNGYAWVEISNTTSGTTTLTITADGIASALPGPTTSDRVPTTGTLGVNDSPQILFLTDALPTASSQSGTNFPENTSSDIGIIDIAEAGTVASINSVDEIRITIPTSKNVTFDPSVNVRLIVTNGGSGGTVDDDQTTAPGTGVTDYTGTLRYENGNKTAVIDIAADFETDDSIQIGDGVDNLTLISTGDSNCNFFLEYSFDGDTTTEVTDDKLIIVEDTNVTFTWTGNTNSAWADLSNWDDGGVGTFRYPGQGGTGDTDNVVIPANPGASYPPLLGVPETINNLSIANAAVLDIGSNVLTVNGTSSNEGRLILSGAAGQGPGLDAGGGFDVNSGTIEYSGGGTVQFSSHYNVVFSSGVYTLAAPLDVNGDLTISGGTVNDGGQLITVAGDWTRTGTFNSNSDAGNTGTVKFDGSGISDIIGITAFYHLTIDTPGKIVRFTNGQTQTVNGTFRAVGNSGSYVQLISTTSGAQWTIANVGNSESVQYAAVKDSAVLNNDISASFSTNVSNNDVTSPGWLFSGTAYTWTGATDSNWGIAGNWSPAGPPGAGDGVAIPNVTNDPQLTATSGAVNVTDLTISAGAVLDLNGYGLTVSDTLTNVGTIRLQGGENVFAVLNTDSGTVEYNGAGSYANLKAGDSYFNLSFSGSGDWTLNALTDVNGDFNLTSGTFNDGGQTVTLAGDWTVAGAATLIAGGTVLFDSIGSDQIVTSGGIDANHDFSNLTIGTSGGAAVVLSAAAAVAGNLSVSTGTLTMGANNLAVTGNLSLGAGVNMTQTTGNLTVVGTADINIGGTNSLTLNNTGNDFQSAVTVTSGLNVTVADTNAFDIGTSTVSGNLDVTAGGNITQSGILSIGGTSTFTLTTAATDVDVSTQANVFTGIITVTNNTNVRNLSIRNDSGAAGIPTLPTGMQNLTLIWNSTGLVLPALTLTGTLDVTTGGNVTQSGVLVVPGTATFAPGAGNSTTLNTSVNNFATVVVSNGLDALFDDTNAIILGTTSITGNLSVTSGGNITDSGTLTIGGSVTMNANAGGSNITLDDNGDAVYNNSYGTLQLTGLTVTVTESVAMDLGTTSATTLTATARTGNISDSNTVTVGAGGASFTTQNANDDIDLGTLALNAAGDLILNTSGATGNATVVNSVGIDFGVSNVGGDLTATATTGSITDTGDVNVTGNSIFTVNDGAAVDIILDTGTNTFTGTVDFNGANLRHVTLVDDTAVDLQAMNISGNLDVTAGGNITQSGILSIAGATTLTASTATTDIDVSTQANVFDGAITVTSNTNVQDLSIRNATGTAGIPTLPTGMRNLTLIWNSTGLVLPALTLTGTLDVTAGGDITQSGILVVPVTATFAPGAGNSTTLNTSVNNFATVVVSNGLDALFDDTNAIILGTTSITGNLSVTSGGNITDSGTLTIGGSVTMNANAGGSNITLDDNGDAVYNNSYGTLQLTGLTVTVTESVAMDLGTTSATTLTATARTGNISDSNTVTVGAGGASFTTQNANDDIDLGTLALNAAGDLILNTLGATGNATVVNSVGIDFGVSNVGGNLSATATTGTITQAGGALTVGGTGSFTTAANDQAITLTNTGNAITGAVTFTTATAGGNTGDVTFDNGTTAVDLGASTVSGSLSVTTGNAAGITDSGVVSVASGAVFTTDLNNGIVNLGTLDLTGGTLVLNTNGTGNAAVVNSTGTDFGVSNVGGNLTATATTGTITQTGGALTIGGTGSFTTAANDQVITLSNTANNFGTTVAFTTNTGGGNTGHVDIRGVSLDFAASTIDGNLNAVAQTGTITQTGGALTIAGAADFQTVANDQVITLSNGGNAITGAVTFTTATAGGDTGDVTFDNGTTAVDLGASTVSGSLSVTTGNAAGITDSGVVSVASGAVFTTDLNNGIVNLGTLDLTGGTLVLNTNGTGNAAVVNSTGIDFGVSNVGGDLTATATTGSITDTGDVNVTGNSIFTVNAGVAVDIILDTGTNTFTGTIDFTGANLRHVTLVDDTAVDLQAMNMSGNLDVTAGGTITDSGTLTIAGTVTMDANTGASDITLDDDGVAAYTNSYGNLTLTGAAVTVYEDALMDIVTFTAGSVTASVTAGNHIAVGSVTATGTVGITAVTGNIYDRTNDAATDIDAGGLITLTATGNIDGNGAADNYLEIAAGDSINASSTTAGQVLIRGLGAITLTDIDTVNGLINITAAGAVTATDVISGGGAGGTVTLYTTTGDISIGAVTSADTVSIDTDNGNVFDAANDALADITAGGLITIDASGNIDGNGAADDYLDIAAGASVDVSSLTGGKIGLRGLGALTLLAVDTANGAIDVTAAGLLTATAVTAGGANNIDLTTTAGGNIIVNSADAAGDQVTFTSAGNIDEDATDDAGNDIIGSVIILNAAAGTIGQTRTLEIDGSTTVLNASTAPGNGNITLYDRTGDLPVGLVTTGSSALGTVSLTSTAGSITDQDGGAADDVIAGTIILDALNDLGILAGPDDVLQVAAQYIETQTQSLSLSSTNAGGNAAILNSGQAVNIAALDIAAAGKGYVLIENDSQSITSSASVLLVGGGLQGNDDIALVTRTSGNVTVNDEGAAGVKDIDTSGIVRLVAAGAGGTVDDAGSDLYIGTGNDIYINAGANTSVRTDAATLTANISNGGTLTVNEDSSVELTLIDTVNANVTVTDAAGNITIGDINAGAGTVWLNASAAGAIDDAAAGADGIADISADNINLDAATGIGMTNPIELDSAPAIDAATTDGDITLSHTADANAVAGNLTTGTGDISFTQTGAATLQVTNATTTDGTIGISNDNGNLTVLTANAGGALMDVNLSTVTAGTIIVDSIAATDTITINSQDAIQASVSDVGLELSATTIDLDADTGIGTGGAGWFDIDASTVSADVNPNGNIDIDSIASGPTTVASLTTGTGSIQFDQTGGQSLNLTTVTTTDGNIAVTNDSNNLTAATVSAGGATRDLTLTTSGAGGDVNVDNVSAVDQVTITAVDGVEESGADAGADVTAAVIDINSGLGIGNTAALEIAGQTITLDSSSGGENINVANSSAAAVSLNSATVAIGAGNITFTQNGGGDLSVDTVSTADGNISITATDGALSNNIGGAAITAGGTGDISLTTAGAANDITIGTVTALGDQITFSSTGAVNDNGFGSPDISAADLVVSNSVSGFGSGGAIDTSVDTIDIINTTSGNIDILEANAVTVNRANQNTAGDIQIISTAGTITVAANGITGTGTGSVTLNAGGAGSDVDINAGINSGSSATGTMSITAADVIYLGAGLTSNQGNITLNGTNIELDANTAITTAGGVAGNITFNAPMDSAGTNTLGLTAGTGNIVFSNAVGGTNRLGALTLNSAVNVTAPAVTLAGLTQLAGTGTTTITGAFDSSANVTIDGTNFDFQNTVNISGGNNIDIDAIGTVTFQNTVDTAAGGTVTVTNTGTLTIQGVQTLGGAFSQDGGGGVDISANITTSADTIDFTGPITLSGNVSLDTGAGANITFANTATIDDGAGGPWDLTVDAPGAAVQFGTASGAGNSRIGGAAGVNRIGTLAVTDAGTLTFNGEVFTTVILQSAGTTSTTFWQPVNTSGAGGISLTGQAVNINNTVTTTGTGPVTITNAGTLTVAAVADMNLGGAFTQNGAGSVSTAGDITTSADTVDFLRAVTLTGAVALDTTNGGGSPLGATVTFSSTLNGTQNLAIDAGTAGDIDFDAAVGTTRLGAVTITNANNVTVDFGFTSQSITQTAGQTLTTFTGAVNTNQAAGIDLSGNQFTFSNTVTTTGGGPVTITNTGTLTINDPSGAADTAVDWSLDGVFTQDGTGTVTTAGDISTTADIIAFSTNGVPPAVTLNGDVALSTGAGIGNITFGGTVDGTAGEILSLTAGTGDVTFSDVLGGTTAIGNFSIISANDVTLNGIGSGSAGAAAVSVTIANQLTMGGTDDYWSSGLQTYTVTTIGTVMNVTAVCTLQGGGAGVQFTDLFIDAPGITITAGSNISISDFVFYRGQLDLGTNNVTLTTTGDFAVFGAAYNADDVDRAATSNEFAYPPADTGPGLAYNLGGSYTAATGTWGAAPAASFSALDGSTISVGGNFYNNGTDMIGTANWFLNVQDNSSSNPTLLNPFGSPYAVAFNINVSWSQAAGGNLSAAEPDLVEHTHNNVTDGGNNIAYNPVGPVNGWDFIAPYIISAEIVKDNIIRITFNEPVENSNNEITAMVANGYTDHTGNISDTAFAANTAYVDNTDASPDALPFTFTSANGDGDLTTFYVQASGGLTWATDADGTNSSVSTTGTDRSGNLDPGTIPDLSWVKGIFWDAGGKNPVWNYTNNGKSTYTGTTDEAGPVLYDVQYGRAVHNQPGTRLYDGHNYFHLYYSEPVDIGTDAAFSATTPTAENVRAQTSFGAGQWGGDILAGGLGVRVVGFFDYNDPAGVGPMSRGTLDGGSPANGLYRDDSLIPGEFSNNDQELRIYLSGYNAGAVPAGDFIGWHSDVPNPSVATTIDIQQNSLITDASGNEIDYTIDLSGAGVFSARPVPDADFVASWDTEEPYFSTYQVSPLSYEIVTDVDIVTQRINRLEFFLQDNYASEDQATLGTWDPENDHPDARANHGIRDYTLNYFGTEHQAFTIGEQGETTLVNTYNLAGMQSDVDNLIFGTLNQTDDPYFALTLNTTHDWGTRSSLIVAYTNSAGSRITDLAGNLLPSTPAEGIAAIERTPPRIELTLASVGSTQVFMRFTEPVFGNPTGTADINAGDFNFSHGTITDLQAIDTMDLGGGKVGILSAWLTLASPLTENTAVEGTLNAFTNSIYDALSNDMPSGQTHRISDIGLGVVTPVWASDGVNSDTGIGENVTALRDFTGSGRLLARNITIESTILASNHTNTTLQFFYDSNVPDDYFAIDPADEEQFLELWLPNVIPGFVETPNTEARGLLPFRTQGAVKDFQIPGGDPEVETGNMLEFVMRLGDLYCARLTDPDDPRTVAPWKFQLQDVIQQRSGVTILNNVINPLNNEKAILTYELASSGVVTVQVFTLDGSIVKVLHRGRQGAGTYTYYWDGTNTGGRVVARGIYFIRVVAPGIDEYRKVMVVK